MVLVIRFRATYWFLNRPTYADRLKAGC